MCYLTASLPKTRSKVIAFGICLASCTPVPVSKDGFWGQCHRASSLTPFAMVGSEASQASKVRRCGVSDGILLLPSVPLRH